jgi:hypothetical protein
VAHASPDAPAVNVTVNGTLAFSNVAYKSVTDYAEVSNNFFEVEVWSGNITLAKLPLTFNVGVIYTVVACGLLSTNESALKISFVIDLDDNSAPPQDSAKLKFFHAVVDAPAVDVKANGALLFNNVSFKANDIPDVTTLAGNYLIEVLPTGGSVPVFAANVTLAPGSVYTLFAEGILASIQAVVRSNAAYTYFEFRAAHTIFNAPAVSVYFGNTFDRNLISAASDVVFENISNYVAIPVETANFIIVTLSGNAIYQSNFQATANAVLTGVITVVASNNATINVVTLSDDNSAPSDQVTSRVKFFHAIPNAPAVNLRINGQTYFTNVSFSIASQYVSIPGKDNSLIEVTVGGNSLFSVIANLTGGAIYSIFAEGFIPNVTTLIVNLDSAYQYFTFRAAHLSPNAPNVDIVLDDGKNQSIVAANVAYRDVSAYITHVWSATQNIVVIGHDTRSVLASVPTEANLINTIAVVGIFNLSLDVVILTDDLTYPTTSITTRFRFSHFAAGAPNVDISLNSQFLPQWQNLGYKNTTVYSAQNITGTNSQVNVFEHGLPSLVLSISGQTLDQALLGGQVVSLFIIGTVPNLSGLVITDKTYTYFDLRLTHLVSNVPAFDLFVDGTQEFSQIPYATVSNFQQLVNAGTKDIQVISDSDSTSIQQNYNFAAGTSTSVVVYGLANNSSFPAKAQFVVEDQTPPTDNSLVEIRVAHFSPGAPNVDVIDSTGNILFSQVSYAAFTLFLKIPQGNINWRINASVAVLNFNATVTGGSRYTLFIEGVFPNKVTLRLNADYVPPVAFQLRVFHASPDTSAVSALVGNNSANFNSIQFGTNTPYTSYPAGSYEIKIQAAGQRDLVYVDDKNFKGEEFKTYSYFFIGLNATNQTLAANTTLSTVSFQDDNTLPAKGGDVRLRFIHLCPNGPPVSLRANGAQLFSRVSYKESTNYTDLVAQTWSFELLGADNGANLISQSFDLSVSDPAGGAVYTLVAEGIAGGNPPLKIYHFLDAGQGNPVPPSSSSAKGLSGVVIGLIIGGVAIFVIVVAAAGFVFWKRRHQRAGYSEIEARVE